MPPSWTSAWRSDTIPSSSARASARQRSTARAPVAQPGAAPHLCNTCQRRYHPHYAEQPCTHKRPKRAGKRLGNAAIHALRLRGERTCAWAGPCRRLLRHGAPRPQRHAGMQCVASPLCHWCACCGPYPSPPVLRTRPPLCVVLGVTRGGVWAASYCCTACRRITLTCSRWCTRSRSLRASPRNTALRRCSS